ncbi:MAG: histidine triad nucleotide-binding protein [Rhodobacteraceae bacterium]|nr:histidine triad nucleotide-binding protein [Paracoccaceae bacterium]
MAYEYDPQNIFAKILRGEIPNTTVMETEHCLAFRDIAPAAPEHILVIPKGAYVNFDHFGAEASDAELVDFSRTVAKIAREIGVAPAAGGSGYRLISNTGSHGVQDVPHLHIHLLGGRRLGRMIEA